MKKRWPLGVLLFLYVPLASGQDIQLQDYLSLKDLRKSLFVTKDPSGGLPRFHPSHASPGSIYTLNKNNLVPKFYTLERSSFGLEEKFYTNCKIRLSPVAIAIPASGIGYGLMSFNSKALRDLDFSTRNEIVEDRPHFHTSIDNYLLFTPLISLTGLNIAGIRGKNKVSEELGIYVFSNLMLLSTMIGTKSISHRLRPDESAYNSFPSGHTAIAFAGAEWLRMEYGKTHPWIGVLGYASASTVGILRIYNNKHWISDVVTGAAVGFLSTRISYLIYPWLKEHLFQSKKYERKNSLSAF